MSLSPQLQLPSATLTRTAAAGAVTGVRRTSQFLEIHYASLPSKNLHTTAHNLGEKPPCCSTAPQPGARWPDASCVFSRDPCSHLPGKYLEVLKKCCASASSSGVIGSSAAGNSTTRSRKVLTGVPGTLSARKNSSNISCKRLQPQSQTAPAGAPRYSARAHPSVYKSLGAASSRLPHLHVLVVCHGDKRVGIQLLPGQHVADGCRSVLLAEPPAQVCIRAGRRDGLQVALGPRQLPLAVGLRAPGSVSNHTGEGAGPPESGSADDPRAHLHKGAAVVDAQPDLLLGRAEAALRGGRQCA